MQGNRDPTAYSRPDPTLGPAGPRSFPPAGQRRLQDISDPIPSCVRRSAPPPLPSDLTLALGFLGPVARLWDLALPASSPTLTPGHGFTHQWGGDSSPGVFWILTSPTREPARVPGPLRVAQPAAL